MNVKQWFKLMDDMTVPGRWHIGAIRAADGTRLEFYSGRVYAPQSLHADVTQDGRSLDFCVSAFNVPVVNRHLAEVIMNRSVKEALTGKNVDSV